jgi:uncharacterized membrane protein
VRRAALIPLGLLVAGAALVVYSVLRGLATVGILVVIPFVVGSSASLAVGVFLIAVGFLTLPFAFAEVEWEDEDRSPVRSGSSRTSGVVVVGPIPFFFGTWRELPRWVPIAVSVAGGAVLAVWLLLAFGVVR